MIQIEMNTEVKIEKKHYISDYVAFVVRTKEGYDFLHLVTDEGIVSCGETSFELSKECETIEEYVETYYISPEWVRMYEDFDSFYLKFVEDENGSHKTVYF